MTLTKLATALKDSLDSETWKPAITVFYSISTLLTAITVGAIADTEGYTVSSLIILYNKIYVVSLAFNLLILFFIARYEKVSEYEHPKVSPYRRHLLLAILGYGFQGAMLSICFMWNTLYQLFIGIEYKDTGDLIDNKLKNLFSYINKSN